jgi:hypothetical protein
VVVVGDVAPSEEVAETPRPGIGGARSANPLPTALIAMCRAGTMAGLPAVGDMEVVVVLLLEEEEEEQEEEAGDEKIMDPADLLTAGNHEVVVVVAESEPAAAAAAAETAEMPKAAAAADTAWSMADRGKPRRSSTRKWRTIGVMLVLVMPMPTPTLLVLVRTELPPRLCMALRRGVMMMISI